MNYTLTGPAGFIATWTLTLPPSSFDAGLDITFANNAIVLNGTPETDTITLFSAADGGGLEGAFFLPSLDGPAIYSGSESSPTLLSGTFAMTGTDGSYSLNATAPAPPTPNPPRRDTFGTCSVWPTNIFN